MVTPDLLRGPPVTIPDLLRSAAVLLAAAHLARTLQRAITADRAAEPCGPLFAAVEPVRR